MDKRLIFHVIHKINSDSESSAFCLSIMEEFQDGTWSAQFIERYNRRYKGKKYMLVFANTGRFYDDILKRNRTYIGELEVNGKCIRNCCH